MQQCIIPKFYRTNFLEVERRSCNWHKDQESRYDWKKQLSERSLPILESCLGEISEKPCNYPSQVWLVNLTHLHSAWCTINKMNYEVHRLGKASLLYNYKIQWLGSSPEYNQIMSNKMNSIWSMNQFYYENSKYQLNGSWYADGFWSIHYFCNLMFLMEMHIIYQSW